MKSIDFKIVVYIDYDEDYATGKWKGYIICGDVTIFSYESNYSRYGGVSEEDVIEEIENKFAERMKSLLGN